MNKLDTPKGKIEDIITRFFYQENQLCFRVMIKLKSGLLIQHNEYNNYDDYRNAYADLLEKKINDNKQEEKELLTNIA